MEENDPRLQKNVSSHQAEHMESAGTKDEPIIFKRELIHERLSREMAEAGLDCEPVGIGNSDFEKGPYSSSIFPLSSLGMTNRGVIRVKGRHFDFVQILQRG
jgi:hypothetical protein